MFQSKKKENPPKAKNSMPLIEGNTGVSFQKFLGRESQVLRKHNSAYSSLPGGKEPKKERNIIEDKSG